jgi:uncharacterized protein YkwD
MHTTRRTRIGRLTAVVLAGSLLLAFLPDGALARSSDTRERWMMKRETNETRLLHQMPRLDLNDRLSDLARQHSIAMANQGSLFHTADPATSYLRGVDWRTWGENVGVSGGTVADLHKAFMRSAPHRANILNRDFRHVAIGAVRVDGTLWVTVFFYG